VRNLETRDLFTGEWWAPSVRRARAHAGPPGSGPKGERCGTCRFCVARRRQRTYYKCGLTDWTFGSATDIRLKHLACWKFEKRSEPWPRTK
jgi:hypothetical protein